MMPYFIITDESVQTRDDIVKSLCEKAGMRRTLIQTTEEKRAKDGTKYRLNQWRDSYNIKDGNMILVVHHKDHFHQIDELHGINMYDVNNNNVIAVDPDDAKALKAYCIGAGRPCYVITVGYTLGMEPKCKIISDFHVNEPNENVILAYIVSKMIEQH